LRPAHLTISLPIEEGNTGDLTRRAQRHLYSLDKIALRLRARDAQRRADHPNPHEIPKLPIFASAETALALNAAAAPLPQVTPPRARTTALHTLANPPAVLVAEGDVAHVHPAFQDLAPAWLEQGWEHRVLCAASKGDDAALAQRLRSNGLSEPELAAVAVIVQASHHLAVAATSLHSWMRIALEVQPNELPVYVQIPVLTKPGIELAAWARFGHQASRASLASQDLAPIATERMAAMLLQTRDIAPTAASDRLGRSAHPYPQERFVGRGSISPVQRLIATFFELAERCPDAIARAAHTNGLSADDAHAALVDLKISTLGRQLRVVRAVE